MSQVAKFMQSNKGKINVNSDLGKNTLFELILPAQNNLVSTILTRIGNQRFAFPETHVMKILRTDKINIQEKDTITVAKLDNQEYKLIDMVSLFSQNEIEDFKGVVIVWNNGIEEIGFHFSDVITFEEMMVNYDDPISDINPMISGTSSLGGEIVYLLNPHAFIEV